ncbi:MAG: hypothetical protein QOE92_444, partial [Chloroflexota bacterium]|nr:hypothetical protein [Chloroflexota bacterium]
LAVPPERPADPAPAPLVGGAGALGVVAGLGGMNLLKLLWRARAPGV